ncbi:MAG: lipopolysaccharide biosynthesis protein [Acidobacteriia bacterium]|nr:lipopolysaccharide biosynthesis protein [Terriglobia bacterium]
MKPFDSHGDFHPLAENDGIRLLAVRGAGATLFSSAMGLAVQIIATVTLARMLTPADFGLVTMVTTFSLLLLNFGINGFTEGIVQRPQITHAMASNLFWINLGIGTLLTLLFAAAGHLLAWFYGDPRVALVAVGVSISIFLTSLSVIHLALLKRAMRFTVVSANDLLARAAAVGLSILLAWAGWGYWSLVAGAIVTPLVWVLGSWYLCRWVPGPPRRVEGTASLFRFALHIYGRFSVNYFARNMDNLLVGWRFNAQALGFYKKAYDLFALSAGQLISPISVVAVAALSRFHNDAVQYRRYLLTSLGVVAFVGMGVGADLTLVGKDIIRVLLGPGWEATSRIFTFFGPGIGIMLLYFTHGWIHLSIGKAERWFRWGIVEFVVTGLLFVLGLHWGPVGVAVAWTASFWILTIPAFWYAGQPIQFGVLPVIAVVWRYLLASVLAAILSGLLLRQLPLLTAAPGALGAFLRILAVSALFAILYFAAVVLLHRSFDPLQRVLRLLKEMAPKGMLARQAPPPAPGIEEAKL